MNADYHQNVGQKSERLLSLIWRGNMMGRITWIFIISSVLISVILASYFILKENKSQERAMLLLPNSTPLQLEASGLLLEKTESSTQSYIRSTDQTTIYTLFNKRKKVGQLHVTVREIDNGDFFVFTQLKNKSGKGYTVSISYPISGDVRYEFIDFDQEQIEHEVDHVYGEDPTTYPIGLLKFMEYDNFISNMMISRNYVSKELVEVYENEDKSIVRELTSENKALAINYNNNGLVVTLPLHSLGNDISENWLLVSQEQLFRNEEVLNRWISVNAKQYKEVNKWYTAEGPYSKLPWSIEPGTKLGYGRNLVRVQDVRALNHYKKTEERYFYDLIINSVANLFVFHRDKKGLWETEYTSTWLKNNYGIHAPYIDTRHNENIAIFLKEVGDVFGIKELKDANITYADFLVNQVKNGGILEIPQGGFLITDYYSPHQIRKTHVSLNHALGEMNFLLETYLQTKETTYLDVAKNMRLGIENIGDKWLRENGDVWYQVNSDFTFEGTDYPLLTLGDLLRSQDAWEAVGEKRSELFDQLILSKAKYLVESNQEILQSIAKALVEQGFGDIIEGYQNISEL